jgi:hypothetical protein
MATTSLRVLIVLCAAAIAAGCRRTNDDDAGDVASRTAARDAPAEASADAPAVLDTTGAWRPEQRDVLPRSEIYYTLTDYDWYAHGEPLLHEGAPYSIAGTPVAASLGEMAKAGEYGGVVYYMRSGEPEPRIYVPVFEGYWLVFRPDTLPPGARAAEPTISR